jgi:hypothetical protein
MGQGCQVLGGKGRLIQELTAGCSIFSCGVRRQRRRLRAGPRLELRRLVGRGGARGRIHLCELHLAAPPYNFTPAKLGLLFVTYLAADGMGGDPVRPDRRVEMHPSALIRPVETLERTRHPTVTHGNVGHPERTHWPRGAPGRPVEAFVGNRLPSTAAAPYPVVGHTPS